MNRRIIAIDDESSILEDYRLILSPHKSGEILDLKEEARSIMDGLLGKTPPRKQNRETYELATARQGEEGYHLVQEACERGRDFAAAFVDIRMPPGWDGVETARKIREADPKIEIVIVTAYSDRDRNEIIEKVGMPERLLYLKKPFDADEIRQLAMSLTRKWELERRAERQRQYLEELLQGIRCLKTENPLSVNELFPVILKEVLSFANASKGCIAEYAQDRVRIEAHTENLSEPELESFTQHISHTMPGPGEISRTYDMMTACLNGKFKTYYILASGFCREMPNEKDELLKLLLETASELIDTVRKQEKFLKNEKIASIGQVSAGLLHEIRNPLISIMGGMDLFSISSDRIWQYVDSQNRILAQQNLSEKIQQELCLVREQYKPENIRGDFARYQKMVKAGIERVQRLMLNISSFTKSGDSFALKLEDITEALDDTLMFADNALKRGIRIHKNWERPLLARCDINSLKQVFLNLVMNAVQAMEGNGNLWIEGRKSDQNIMLCFRDSGPGIPDKDRSRIFEAFYTTKAEGTGLGLSIVKGIIDRHKGRIWAESDGNGAVFRIELPQSLEGA
jgi:signal transduction histidine kinase/DNA-binding LytR/AlgR family response regulator